MKKTSIFGYVCGWLPLCGFGCVVSLLGSPGMPAMCGVLAL
jgi:hypothetical protein